MVAVGLRKSGGLWVILALILAGCGGAPSTREVADLVLIGGTVHTVNADQPRAQAVAIQGNRIAFVGSRDGVDEWIDDTTEVIDIAGGMLLPGFQDAHVHVLESGMAMADCDLSRAVDAAEVLSMVTTCAATDGQGGWLRGGGFQLTYFPGGNPLAKTLDAIVPDRPVFLTSSDAHSAWVNSVALQRAGITAETADPPAGRIERDPGTGEPTGTLRETAIGLVEPLLPPRTLEERVEGLLQGLAIARRFGITAFQDANVDAANLAAYSALAEAGELTARVSISLQVDPNRGVEQVSELVALRDRYDSDLLRVGTVKLFIDGVAEAQTAALLEPYLGMGDFTGYAELDGERLRTLVVELDRQGFQIHAHAIGDRAIREILDAIEEARASNGRRDSRHHLAHIQIWNPSDIPRMRELEVAANFQPLWAYADPFITDLTEPFLGPERSRWLYPIRSLVESGARVVFGSDWDVSTMNPLPAIEVGITRQDPENPSSPVWLPEQRVDLETMLAGYTSTVAWVNFLEQQTGTIEVGKLADLVVVNRDLFSIPPQEISDARVVLTLFDGEVVNRATAR